ncbi:M48 family metallopeptidase [Streptomyces collinus]|uniref:M48 family metallopeptidase n=1 Tax=Streptomyces collinus TaxID=42684 RepID=UPI0036B87990
MEHVRHDRPAGSAHVGMPGAAAYAVAGLVHLVTGALFTGSLLLIVVGFHTVTQPLIGFVLLVLALAMRPRVGRLDPDLPTLRPSDAPALFRLLDEVADASGVRHVDAVQFSTAFSVTVTRYGIRRRRCLVLGLPLWVACPPQQRVAAVAQALARTAPHDIRSGAFVGMALESLTAGLRTLRANGDAYIEWTNDPTAWRAGDVAGGARRFNARARSSEWLLWIPRTAMTATARLLLRLTLPATRNSQLEADDATARTASSEAAIAALNDQRLARAIGVEMHRLVIETKTLSRKRPATASQPDFWEAIACHAALLRETRDSDRPTGAEAPAPASDAGRDPFDALRVTRLADHPRHPATVSLDEAGLSRIADELRTTGQALLAKMMRDGAVPA